MKKISNDNNFANYLNKYINVEVDGVTKKFFVTEINANSFIANAGILNNYTTLGESSIQECDVCEDPCFNSIPIIELNFNGIGVTGNTDTLINNKYNETHDVYINNNKICRIDTSILSTDFNRLWLIPYYSSNVQTPTIFDDYYYTSQFSSTSTASCVFFDPSFYNKQNWNNLVIKPISAYNPALYNNPIPETFYSNFFISYATNFDRRISSILTNKILVNSSNVSSISCVAWYQYDMGIDYSGEFNSQHCLANTGGVYLSSTFQPYTECQEVSTFFMDLDPCINPTEYGLGFTYNGTRYYTNSSQKTYIDNEVKYAYTPYESISDPNFGAPILRKYIFFTDCSRSNTIVLYQGFDPRESYTQENGGYRWYTDLGITPFTGSYNYIFYNFAPPEGLLWNVNVVNGYEVSQNQCT